MAYRMKRGNSVVPFKQLGSSPAKQIDPLDLGLIDEAKKFDKVHKARKSMDKFLDKMTKKHGTTPSYISDVSKKGVKTIPKSSASDRTLQKNLSKITDRYRTATSKGLKQAKKPTSTLGRVTKAFKNTSKQLAKPGLKVAKQIGKKFLEM